MIKYSYKQYCIDCDSSTALPTGTAGRDGQFGGYSSKWKFSTNTAIADPTSNYIRFNSSTYSAVTTILVSQTNIDGTDMEGFLTSFINNNSYGFIRLFKEFDSNVHWYGRITNVVDNGAYFTLTVVNYDSNSAFVLNDAIVLTFDGSGNSDTGWLDLQGFSHTPNPPQYRIVNKMMVFRGSLIIPLDNGSGTVVPYSGGNSYAGSLVTPYSGAGGVSIFSNKITMNLGASVLQSAAHNPDTSYSLSPTIGLRTIVSTTAGTYIPYTGYFFVSISGSGVLSISTIVDQEDFTSPYTGLLGASPLRMLTSNVVANDYALDWRTVNVFDTMHGITAALDLDYLIKRQTIQHSVTMDAANPSQIGGFVITLTGLTAMVP